MKSACQSHKVGWRCHVGQLPSGRLNKSKPQIRNSEKKGTGMETQAQAKQLWFHYTDENGERTSPDILKDISLSIDKGDFVALLGHNGSGKSTFAKHMNAILLPSAGTMTVDGIDTKDESQRFTLRSHVGMVFQNPDNQIVATIVEEDVAFGPENLGIPPQEIRKRVDDALKAVEMYEYREHAPSQLSGGQKQRVAIAGIIAMRPDCIVLDEPTAMLDPSGRREVMNTIHMLNREYGITIVLITHYMEEAAQANRVVVMDDGKVVLDNTPKEVFSHVETLKKIGLDVPQVTELAYRLQQAGCPVDVHMISEEECVAALTKLLSGKTGGAAWQS
jgi:energy-coupling factor transport system ATP-binding protein